MKYKAVLISPDGQDKVTDFHESNTIAEVEDKLANMGSRWYFYPIAFVIPDNNTNISNNRIVSTPDEFKFLKLTTVKSAMNWITNHSDYIETVLN